MQAVGARLLSGAQADDTPRGRPRGVLGAARLEVGDGTLELREVPDAMAYVDKMLATKDLLVNMNLAIKTNKDIGIYDGCKNAVQLAKRLSAS